MRLFAGGVAGVAFTLLVWAVNTWQLGSGYVSPGPFWLLFLLGAVGWMALRAARTPQDTVPGRFAATVQTTLAIAVPLLGLSASLAGYYDSREGAYGGSMRSDLRSLLAAEQQFLADSGRYTEELRGFGPSFGPSRGIIGPTVTLTSDGWTASIGYAGSPRTCAIFVGSTSLPPAVAAKEIACTRLPFPTAGVAAALGLIGLGLTVGTLAGARRSPTAAGEPPGAT